MVCGIVVVHGVLFSSPLRRKEKEKKGIKSPTHHMSINPWLSNVAIRKSGSPIIGSSSC